jgi:hypothetical protein
MTDKPQTVRERKEHGPVIVDAVVKDGAIKFLNKDGFAAASAKAAKAWGEGRSLKCRIEPEEEALAYSQLKHYWGHVVTPFYEYTGNEKHEAHWMLKAECMPEGKTSITELNHEEMAVFVAAAERTARRWCPEAFALYDQTA